ncbi:MAG: hypothetical protein IJO74_03920 [Clostridia bacterium]|nr:hypothetical protein [Clostridia bacterium]
MKLFKQVGLGFLILLTCITVFACKKEGAKSAVIAFPKDVSGGYNWDTPQFDEEYFSFSSQRSYSEKVPGLPDTTYHEWTFIPKKQGITDIVFVQYDSRQALEEKTDPFKKITVTYEIYDDLTVAEKNRVEINYKEFME